MTGPKKTQSRMNDDVFKGVDLGFIRDTREDKGDGTAAQVSGAEEDKPRKPPATPTRNIQEQKEAIPGKKGRKKVKTVPQIPLSFKMDQNICENLKDYAWFARVSMTEVIEKAIITHLSKCEYETRPDSEADKYIGKK